MCVCAAFRPLGKRINRGDEQRTYTEYRALTNKKGSMYESESTTKLNRARKMFAQLFTKAALVNFLDVQHKTHFFFLFGPAAKEANKEKKNKVNNMICTAQYR